MNFLENVKRDEISSFSNYKWLANWESFLTSDFWKSWRGKISDCQTEKELRFYVQRLREIADLISRCEKYGDGGDDLLIKKEEKRLENISLEDFKKEDKFADVEFKELSTEEMLNDKWFNDKIFGSENEKLPKVKKYKNLTQEQLIAEINRLKTENEVLKTNQTLTISEKENRLKINQQKLDRLSSYYNKGSRSGSQPNSFNNKFPTSWVVSGAFLLGMGGIFYSIILIKKKLIKK